MRNLAPIVIAATMWLTTGCSNAPGAGVRWSNYPKLSQTPTLYRWLIVECKLADVDAVPTGLDTTIRQFFGLTGAGYGNIVDYYYDVSYNNAAFVPDFVNWVPAPFKFTDIKDPRTPVGGNKRAERVRECLEAIPSDQTRDLGGYYGVIAIGNAHPADASACYAGQQPMSVRQQSFKLACVWFDSESTGTAFATHEISHGFGLSHSFDDTQSDCGGSPGEYCDPWDIMSAMRTFQFVDRNWLIAGNNTSGGPGMSTPNLLLLGWLPAANQSRFNLNRGEQIFTINALSHPKPEAPLVVLLDIGESVFQDLYTVEYRQADGWDLGISSLAAPFTAQSQGGAVLVHRYRSGEPHPVTLLGNADMGAREPGNTLVLTNIAGHAFHITVKNIDTTNGTATVSIGSGRG